MDELESFFSGVDGMLDEEQQFKYEEMKEYEDMMAEFNG